ncbi:MAG: hypothetical protein NVSMB6_25640 [Burkholderiaceae bacterium]
MRREMDFLAKSKPSLITLSDNHGEAVHLANLGQTIIIYINRLGSKKSVGMTFDVGQHKPGYYTAEGKVLLAFKSLEMADRIVAAGTPVRLENKITDHDARRRELALSRSRGYAVDNEKCEDGLRVVAAPVRDQFGNVIAARSVACLAQRMTKKKSLLPARPSRSGEVINHSRPQGCHRSDSGNARRPGGFAKGVSRYMYTITIADTGQQFECAPDDTMLRAGLRAGLGLSYQCNVGSCGSCKTELLAGEVQSNWPGAPALNDRDRARNRVLGCQTRPLGDCIIQPRLGTQYETGKLPHRFTATLRMVRILTHDMREFSFSMGATVDFLPGQYALLYFPGVDGPRAYSMSSIPAAGGATWDFIIKQMPGGAGSAALFERLAVGDSIAMDGPYGMAYLREESPRDIICIAGGSGLAPVLSIARGVAANPAMATRKLHLFYGGRGVRDLCGEEMLQTLPGFGTRFFYHPIISVPDESQVPPWPGRVGFVHEMAEQVFGHALAEHEIYFAGPPAMARAVQLMLHGRVPRTQVHFDAFY